MTTLVFVSWLPTKCIVTNEVHLTETREPEQAMQKCFYRCNEMHSFTQWLGFKCFYLSHFAVQRNPQDPNFWQCWGHSTILGCNHESKSQTANTTNQNDQSTNICNTLSLNMQHPVTKYPTKCPAENATVPLNMQHIVPLKIKQCHWTCNTMPHWKYNNSTEHAIQCPTENATMPLNMQYNVPLKMQQFHQMYNTMAVNLQQCHLLTMVLTQVKS